LRHGGKLFLPEALIFPGKLDGTCNSDSFLECFGGFGFAGPRSTDESLLDVFSGLFDALLSWRRLLSLGPWTLHSDSVSVVSGIIKIVRQTLLGYGTIQETIAS
jgi:hypothetical protein